MKGVFLIDNIQHLEWIVEMNIITEDNNKLWGDSNCQGLFYRVNNIIDVVAILKSEYKLMNYLWYSCYIVMLWVYDKVPPSFLIVTHSILAYTDLIQRHTHVDEILRF